MSTNSRKAGKEQVAPKWPARLRGGQGIRQTDRQTGGPGIGWVATDCQATLPITLANKE